MALKDWNKLHTDDYETKEAPRGKIWANHYKSDDGFYRVWHKPPMGYKDCLSRHRTIRAAHAALMKHIRKQDY